VGLLETRGFPAMVGAADAMLKTADVQLAGYETIGDGLCTIVIRGAVADVAMAVEAGMHEAERIGELHSVMVIPRPLDDLEETLPIASCWLEHPQPLPTLVPLATPQETAIPLQLPDLQEVPVPLHKTEPMRRQAETVQAETVQVEIVKPDPTDDR
jgi:carbon dioxide concentrating mechanism protein CcmO